MKGRPVNILSRRGLLVAMTVIVVTACGGTIAESTASPARATTTSAATMTTAAASTARPTTTAVATLRPTAASVASTAPVEPITAAQLVVVSLNPLCSGIVGVVRNVGGSDARAVSAITRFYLPDGALWTTGQALTSPSTIRPGSTASFEVVASKNPCIQGVRGEIAFEWAGGSAAAAPIATAPPAPTATPTTRVSTPAPTTAVLTVRIANSQYGTLGAITLTGASCTARARLPSGSFSEAAGIQTTQIADGQGAVNWSYGTSTRTTPGTGTHTVTCTYQGQTQSASATFTVP